MMIDKERSLSLAAEEDIAGLERLIAEKKEIIKKAKQDIKRYERFIQKIKEGWIVYL